MQAGVNAGKAAARFAGGVISGGAELAVNAFDWLKAGITGKPTDVLNFTGQSGKYENFAALNADMQKAVVLAATDYKKATGRKITVNSARRAVADQERLWAQTVALGTPGRGPQGMLVAKPPRLGGNPPHLRGNAIDLQEAKSDQGRALPILARYGLKQTYGARDPVHVDLKAMDGGIFDGPSVGFPSDADRGKKLGSLKLDSVLMKLAKTGSDSLNTVMTSTATDNHAAEDQGAMNLELYNMIQHKLDNVLNALDSSHSTQSKILKHSMV